MNYTLIFLIALTIYTLARLWLNRRQRCHVGAHRNQVPAAFLDRIALNEHQKAADYTLAKANVTPWEILLDTALLLFWTLGGGLQWIHEQVAQLDMGPVITGTLVILALIAFSSLASLPFSLYRTFVVEERFGFNRTSRSLWLIDLFKGLALGLLLGGPLILLILWLMQSTGEFWWVMAWTTFVLFGLFINWAFPVFIAPLFNTFTPLRDEQLKASIEQLLSASGFQSSGIYVVDGSRRSGHGNAYFAGFGRNKRIVFYDTLLENLSSRQILAVLAHELGHFYHRHILKNLVLSSLLSLAGFAALAWLIKTPTLFEQLGVSTVTPANGLLLFLLLAPLLTFYTAPLLARLSRRFEFQADQFAAEKTRGEDLVSALVQLYQDNASTLTPDPIHSAFFDSHPPAAERIRQLQTC